MSILERLSLGIKTFTKQRTRERVDYRSKPANSSPASTFNPNKPPPAMQKALAKRSKQEQAWTQRAKTRRAQALQTYPELRTYLATLKQEAARTDILFDGVLDIDIRGLIEDLKLDALPDSAKHVALDATRSFVSDVHTAHYGSDPGCEMPWMIPEGVDYTDTEAKKALWPNGITYDFGDEVNPNGSIASFFKKKSVPT